MAMIEPYCWRPSHSRTSSPLPGKAARSSTGSGMARWRQEQRAIILRRWSLPSESSVKCHLSAALVVPGIG